MLTEAQLAALGEGQGREGGPWRVRERASGLLRRPGYLYVGNLRGWAESTSRPSLTPMPRSPSPSSMTARPRSPADLLNDRVIPFFDSQAIKLLRVLTDRGSENCGNPERHEYELYLAIEDMDHSRTKTKSRKPMASASASTRPCSTSSTASPSARRCIAQSRSCGLISMLGCSSTISHAHIKDAGASERRRCKPSRMRCQ